MTKAALAAILLAWPAALAGQAPRVSQAASPGVKTDEVEIEARVTDDRGRFFRGLTVVDFQVFEDGEPHPVTGVSIAEILDPRAADTDPDVRTKDPSGGVGDADALGLGSAIDPGAAIAFERPADDERLHYVLTYSPPATARDGKVHRITVRVTRPGVTVNANSSYTAPDGAPAPAPAPRPAVGPGPSSNAAPKAVSSPAPANDLQMRVFAAPFRGDGGAMASILLGIELDGPNPALTPNSMVEFSYQTVDAKGTVRRDRLDSGIFKLRPDDMARARDTGLRVLQRLELPPGRYQLSVSSRDVVGGATGEVVATLDVPDFAAMPFSMSDVLVASFSGARAVTARSDERLKPLLADVPVALRVFAQDDELTVFVEVYDRRTPPHIVDLATTVRSDDGSVAFETREERDSSAGRGADGRFTYSAQVRLMDLDPGVYELAVEARPRGEEKTSATGRVRFRVTASGRTR